MHKMILLLACLLSGVSDIFGQSVPPLERTITITFQDEKIDVALSRISQQGKFVFSYNPAILSDGQTVTTVFSNKSVREILNELFEGRIAYKERGNYIILTKAPQPPQKASVDIPLTISGYVVNGETGEKLSEVSVYDKRTLSATVTNSFGFFKIRIDKPSDENTISVSKKDFNDTTLVVNSGEDRFVNIMLAPQMRVIVEKLQESDLSTDSVSEVQPNEADVPERVFDKKPPVRASQINIRNIKDTLYRKAQLSLLPFVGTNHVLSGNVINDYSFNIIGGYSLGTRRAEFAGVFNSERGNVTGAQFAGVFNAVWGDVTGLQMAGTVNANHGKVDAWQFSGTVNANLSDVKGPQFAGVLNANLGTGHGAQFAGTGNVQIGDYTGPQFAGVFNVAVNKITGAQLAGVLNFGRIVHGTQIGLINVADSMKGVPIGFLSFVRKGGYHKFEISADEVFYTNLAFRTGVYPFYNIITGGFKLDKARQAVWTFGYGIGTSPRLTNWLYLNFDLTSSHIVMTGYEFELNLLNKFYMGADFKLGKNLSLTMGATLNGYVTDSNEPLPNLFTAFTPHFTYDDNLDDVTNLKMWWGGKIGLRFL